jgi:RNA polymerase sigma-70 factor (ECF subfamily)
MGSSFAGRTSASLLARLRQDATDQAAWAEFVRRYSRPIFHWCRKWKLQEADAQDVTQTVLLKLARQMRTFAYDPTRSFRAFLKTITHRAWCNFLESRRRPGAGSGDSAVLELLQTVAAREDLVEHLGEEFDRELLDEAMARVRKRVEAHTWEAFARTALEGLSGAVVAQQLGLKVATVFRAKSKVLKMLQEEIARLEAPGERTDQTP